MDDTCCPTCGHPKHPLKTCPHCGHSQRQQLLKERQASSADPIPVSPKRYVKGVGYLGRRRAELRPSDSHADDRPWYEPLLDPQAYLSEYLADVDLPSGAEIIPTWSSSPADGLPEVQLGNLRLASRIKKAAPWLGEAPTPLLPVDKQREVYLYDGWPCAASVAHAQRMIQARPAATLREVQQEIVHQVARGKLWYPHLWWIAGTWCRFKPLYRDANGIAFVLLDEEWYPAWSLRDLGDLVGLKGTGTPQEAKLPLEGYFVCWDNELVARRDNPKGMSKVSELLSTAPHPELPAVGV